MISRLGVEEINLNNTYLARNDNKKAPKSPSFKAGGLFPIILQGVQACEQNPMINVAVIDMFSAILPRTFVESLTNWFAGFEAFRRESSGLIVNCMIPSVVTLGLAKLVNSSIMPKGANLASCWADSNMISKMAEIYESSSADDKVLDSMKKILSNVEGFDGNQKLSYKDILSEAEIEKYSRRLKDLTTKELKRKDFNKQIKAITDEIVSKTKIYENIHVNGGKNPVKSNTVEALLSDTVKFFKEYQKASDTAKVIGKDGKSKELTIAEFAKKSKKLVRTKSIMGLGVILPLAASMQYINRWITEKLSGVKGAPIYNDYGKDKDLDEAARKKAKEGLLKQKLISISSMLAVGFLSMMKMPTMNMLEFKGIFPTMDQARLISTTTFASRMAAADDEHELAEATVRDIATFLSLYFLGDYAAKGAATIIEKKKGVKLLNDTKPLKKDANIFQKAWHWFKDVNVKSSKEVRGEKAIKYRSACQVANLGVSLVLLGLVIPIFVRKNTEKKHAADLKTAERDMSKNTANIDSKANVKRV